MELRLTLESDLPLIRHWIASDPFHKDEGIKAEWLLTGHGLLSFCLCDAKGPLAYIRLDQEEDKARVAIQFGPEQEVSKRRLVVGLVRFGFPAIIRFAKKNGFKGVVFQSESPLLIDFLTKHQGIVKSARENNYELIF